MREIIFKAKAKNRNVWVEGYYCKRQETTYCFSEDYEKNPVPVHHYIVRDEMTDWGLPNELRCIEVDPETVCQFTGQEDKNGKKIWENDILQYSYDYPGSPWLAAKGKKDEDIEYKTGAVFWSDWRGTWSVCAYGKSRSMNQDIYVYSRNPNRTEVIGNIFDSPELVEEKKQEKKKEHDA